MELKLPLKNPTIDADLGDLKEGCEIYIYSDVNDLFAYNSTNEDMEGTIFGLWINCGKNKERALMFDIEIDSLEEFAYAVLKRIELIRRNHSEQIKNQTDKGINI
jgi:hypothetical protein